MPSKTDSRIAQPADFDDLDNYFLEGDLDDDPFASPKPDKPGSGANKRKAPGDGLGIDEEVSVAKKVRVPRVKLDQERLLSQKGIPSLRKRARDLKLKGKGHEWGDASRLLSFYQEWLDDLFPKAKFLDALAMVEKTGHNKMVQKMRVDWINESKPKDTSATTTFQEEEEDQHQQSKEQGASRQAERVAPIFEKAVASGGRPRTPEMEGVFGDDIYNATPIGAGKNSGAADEANGPDDDELDALMAEEEGSGRIEQTTFKSSIFGDGKPKAAEKSRQVAAEEPEEDDLDALLAEAEAEGSAQKTKNTNSTIGGDGDDQGALLAEAEAGAEAQFALGKLSGTGSSASKQPVDPEFNDDEEALAEMDGLW